MCYSLCRRMLSRDPDLPNFASKSFAHISVKLIIIHRRSKLKSLGIYHKLCIQKVIIDLMLTTVHHVFHYFGNIIMTLHTIQQVKNNCLYFALKESKLKFSHKRGIFLTKIFILLLKMLLPNLKCI